MTRPPGAVSPGQDGYLVAEAARVITAAARAPYSDACRQEVLDVLHLVALSQDGGGLEAVVLRIADFVEVIAAVAGGYARENTELHGDSMPRPEDVTG